MSDLSFPDDIQHLSKQTAYLAGPMEFAEDAGLPWREEYRKELAKLNIQCIIPHEEEAKIEPVLTIEELKTLKRENLPTYKEHYRKNFMLPDINIVRSVDFLIIRWNGEQMSGTIAEANEAFLQGKPVYLVTNQQIESIPGWFLSCCTEEFTSLSCLLLFLSKKSFYKR